MIKLSDLNVTQHGLRLNQSDIDRMIDFVAKGGKFNKPSMRDFNPKRLSLIAINQFEDGRLFVRDGLHRVCVIDFARKERVLYDDEYVLEHYTYDSYMRPNLADGFYTPFDPRTEVRLPDFFDFKEEVLKRIKANDDPEGFIKKHRELYVRERGPEHKDLVTFSNSVSSKWI